MGCSGAKEEKENFILTEHYVDEYDVDKEIEMGKFEHVEILSSNLIGVIYSGDITYLGKEYRIPLKGRPEFIFNE